MCIQFILHYARENIYYLNLTIYIAIILLITYCFKLNGCIFRKLHEKKKFDISIFAQQKFQNNHIAILHTKPHIIFTFIFYYI